MTEDGGWGPAGVCRIAVMAQPSRNNQSDLFRDNWSLPAPTTQIAVRAKQCLFLLWLEGRSLFHLQDTDGTDGSMLPRADVQLRPVPPAVTVTRRKPEGGKQSWQMTVFHAGTHHLFSQEQLLDPWTPVPFTALPGTQVFEKHLVRSEHKAVIKQDIFK